MTLALALALLSGFVYWNSARRAPAIEPLNISVDLKEIKAHAKTPFEFVLTNRGSQTWKVAGTPSICKKVGCVWALDPPTELKPNQPTLFRFLCDADQAGPLRLETAVYLEIGKEVGATIPILISASVSNAPAVSPPTQEMLP